MGRFIRSVEIFLVLVLALGAHAQSIESGSPTAKAMHAARDGKWNEVVKLLEPVAKSKWRSAGVDRAVALLIEANLHLGKRAAAREWGTRFLGYYSRSAHRDRVRTAMAILDVQDGNVFGGSEALLAINRQSANPFARWRAKEALLRVLTTGILNSGELGGLFEQDCPDGEIKAWIQLQMGREFQNEGRYKAARWSYQKIAERNDNLGETARKGLELLEDKGPGIPSLLVLAPLSGDMAEFGNAMLQGVLLAMDDIPKGRLLLRVADTRADPVIALQRVKSVLEQDSILGIVGPVMSAPAATVAAWLAVTHPSIAMITPTATDDGIAQLGSNIFQLNISLGNLASGIAEHAVKCLDIREFAIMSPLSDYGRLMTQEFSRKVEALGGEVVMVQYYPEGRPDYKTEFGLMRSRRFEHDNRMRNLSRGKEPITFVGPKERREYMEDSTMSFGALFIPASDPADAAKMAAQAAFNKIDAQLLGSSGWYGRALLVDGKRQVESSRFSAPFIETSDDSTFQYFSKKFMTKYQSLPSSDKVSGLGYDATRILMRAWQAQANRSDLSIPAIILGTGGLEGVYGPIRFHPQTGANSSLHVVTVQKGKFTLVSGCQSGDK